MRRYIFLLVIAGSLSWTNCLSQSVAVTPSAASDGTTSTRVREATGQLHDLTLLSTVKATYVNAGMFLYPLKCDRDSNLYLRNLIDGVPGIHKLAADGKQLAVIQPDSATPDLRVDVAGYFSVATGGSVYQLIGPHEINRYLFVYGPDGNLRSYAKLDTGFPWVPAQVTAFPSGNVLVTGLEYDHDRTNSVKWPFTGIFSSTGTLLKEVKLEDDDAIHDMAAAGDARVVSPGAPGVNHAVGLGQMDAASDGNIYIMRRLSPAIFYAISPEGEVVRRFTVNAGQPDYMPDSMHIAGNRIAVQFAQPQSDDQLIKIVDLEGRELVTYHIARESPLGFALACYSTNPERFTFLGVADDDRLTLNVAGPR
jgi:hypothetical protein